MSIVNRLREFMESEARSCSMVFGCITPLYVYRCRGEACLSMKLNGQCLIYEG